MAQYRRNKYGDIILKSGGVITKSEQARFRNLVYKANVKREKILSSLDNTAEDVFRYFRLENDWVYRRKSYSLKRFSNRWEFKRYVKNLERITRRDWETIRNKLYKDNYILALKRNFNSKASELIKLVKQIDNNDFANAVLRDEIHDIPYIYYDPNDEKFTKIKSQLEYVIGSGKK